MCCIDVCPIQFLAWAKPIIEKKETILARVHAEADEETAAYNALPWYKKLFVSSESGLSRAYYVSSKMRKYGWHNLPTVDRDKYVPLASYCAAQGVKMPLETSHDFFKG